MNWPGLVAIYGAFGVLMVALDAVASKCRRERFRPRRAVIKGALWPVALGLLILFAVRGGRA